MESIWDIVNPAITAVVVALVGVLIAQGIAWLRRRTSQEQLVLIQWIVSQAVNMAEQIGADNADKKRLAIEHAQALLEKYGIKLDLVVLEAAIEAAVFSELKKFKQPQPAISA